MAKGLDAQAILAELQSMYRRRGHDGEITPATALADLGFRSLDFSELALRLEGRIGSELNFGAAELRRVEYVSDVVGFFEAVAAA